MSTFLVLREMDPGMTEGEREGMNSRAMTAIEIHPNVRWLRSYLIDSPARFASFCLYEGVSREAVASHSDYCRVPYHDIREVTETIAAAYGIADQAPGEAPLFVVRRQFGAGITGEELDAVVSRSAGCLGGFDGLRWERSFWDPARSLSHCIYRAPSKATLVEHAALARIPADTIEEVVEAHPSQWVEMFESLGIEKYWEGT